MTTLRSPHIAAIALFVALISRPAAAQITIAPQQIAAESRAATVQVRTFGASGAALSEGSGFLVTPDGVIVTNFHVIEGASSVEVTTMAGETYDNVFFVTADPRRDLAVLRIPVEGAPSLRISPATTHEIGSRVFATGNPLGQTGTFSDGMVSAHRTVEGVQMIQVSAPISPGSSGGPVMNESGEVIGVATMLLTGGQNLNYAVPAHYVRPLLSTGEAPRRFTRGLLPAATGGLAIVGQPRDTDRQSGGTIRRRPPASSTDERAGTGIRRRSPAAPGRGQNTAPDLPAATDRYEQDVLAQLAAYDEAFSEDGFIRSHEVVLGSMREGGRTEIVRTYRSGQTYGIMGACDRDCDDLDLFVYAPSGTLLDSDVELDDTPLLTLVARTTGTYRIVVSMASCTTAPCAWGVMDVVAP